MKQLITAAIISALFSASVSAEETSKEPAEAKAQAKKSSAMEHLQILGRSDKLRTEAGSATLIDELMLEKYEYDDIHRVLANVPGVNIRQEDGYGLRPNIGFRGVTPERSKKINIMEDGVLIGPAPYSAPAAYYFPSVNRMTSVEVFKGPAAIKYGPNTVAGALNMTTRAIPDEQEGFLELGLGSNGYKKLHSYFGDGFHPSVLNANNNNFGYLFEIGHASADGFKEIDNVKQSMFEQDSGFSKNDLMFKANYLFDANLFGFETEQFIELKTSYSDEVSNETYMGLTDADFQANPYRRYAVSQVGKMDWNHQQVQLTHNLTTSAFKITTRLYRNDFERAWRKVNGFNNTANPATDRTLQDIIAFPELGINEDYYQILTGQKDSEAVYEQLVVGTNDRNYYSQGLQSDISFGFDLLNLSNVLHTGIRLHEDKINRNHFEQNYLMLSGAMTPDALGPKFTTVNSELSDTMSVYLEDTIKWQSLEVTAGVRGEFNDSKYQNRKEGKEQDWLEKSSTTWLHSISAFYTINAEAGVFFGMHEGFVPTSPKQSAIIKPERSVNYELGGRYHNGTTKLESVLFFNDFNNLKESCSFSTSASCTNQGLVDQEYNGGEVDVYGLEFSLDSRVFLTDEIDLPWSVTYTNTQSEFKQALNSTFELWGNIEAGDPVPYLPEQQLTVNLGLETSVWQLNVLVKYTDQMQEAAGADVALTGLTTDEYTVLDISANYDMDEYGIVYVKVDNVFDKVALVSRRPFGARPSKPQQLFIGYKYHF